ncbi:YitT family protein [Streptomyces sp. NPDC048650]|uniref:membrane protein YczE n=1 Tax=Streptomyces sp. NPDC048650 TaxID=3365583 RepID=UPI0037175B5A
MMLRRTSAPEATVMEHEATDRGERVHRRRPRSRAAGPRPPGTRPRLPPLTYVPLRERPLRRLPQLFAGLALYGFSLSVLVRSSLGANPWSVLYEGLARHISLSFGTITAALGVLVLLLWIPLEQRPTFGTFANVVVLACSSDLGLRLIPQHLGLPARALLLVGGVLLNGLSVAVYVGARFGPGPRDGLMTGAASVTGRSLRLVRTLVEIAVLVVGWLLGGRVGVGTVVYALAVGPVTQFLLRPFAYRSDAGRCAPGCTATRSSAQDPAGPSGG